MKYEEAIVLDPNNCRILLRINDKYQSTYILRKKIDSPKHRVIFQCTDGKFTHEEVSPPLPYEELERRFIDDPDTRVFISFNDEAGVWQYSVVVMDSGGYWLDSFPTQREAEDYIRSHGLTMADNSIQVQSSPSVAAHKNIGHIPSSPSNLLA